MSDDYNDIPLWIIYTLAMFLVIVVNFFTPKELTAWDNAMLFILSSFFMANFLGDDIQ